MRQTEIGRCHHMDEAGRPAGSTYPLTRWRKLEPPVSAVLHRGPVGRGLGEELSPVGPRGWSVAEQ